MSKGIFLAGGVFAFYLLLEVTVFRVIQPRWRFIAMNRLYLALIPVFVGVCLLTPPSFFLFPPGASPAGSAIVLLNGLVVYSFLFVGNCMFYFLIDRGFSVRILIEVGRSPERALTLRDLCLLYPPDQALARRISELETYGRILREDRHLRLTPRGILDARVFLFMKKFLQMGKGG